MKIEDINLETDLENNDEIIESENKLELDSDLNALSIEELQKTIENQKLKIYNLETKLNKLKEFIN